MNQKKLLPATQDVDVLSDQVVAFLDQQKAEQIVKIDLRGKSSMADFMIVATGPSSRFVSALADKTQDFFTEKGIKGVTMEGLTTCDWVLVDAHNIIVHLFRPEARDMYQLEKMWGPHQ